MEHGTQTPSLEEAMQRGVTAAQMGEREEANRVFRELVEEYPNSADIWVWLGGTSADLDEAEIAFEQAKTLDPNNEKANLGLRWVQLKRGETESSTIVGAPVPMPAQPDWVQTGQIDSTPATSQLPEVEGPVQPGADIPFSGKFAAQEPAVVRQAGLSRTAIILTVVIVLLVLAALGYWFFLR
jgi:tetratricopeptide (TPR) repeat protein